MGAVGLRGGLLVVGLVVAAVVVPWAVASPVNGVPDATWQANGRVRAVVYAAGVVYLGGEFTQLVPPAGTSGSPVVRNHLAALSEATGQLLGWDPNADGTVWSLAVSGSGVYLGGDFANVGGQARSHAAVVDAATGAVTGWDPEPDGSVKAVAVGPNGDLFLGGNFTHVAGKTRNHLADVTPAGVVASWNPAVKQVSGSTCPPRCSPFVAALAFSADGSALYFGGHFGLVNGVGRNNAAAVSLASGGTLAWNPDVFGTGVGKNPNQANKVWHVELGPDRAYVCGDYWSLDGLQRHPNLAAVDLTSGQLITSFDATTDGNTPACRLVGGFLYIGGHYQHVGPNSAWVLVSGQKSTLTGPGSAVREHLAAFDATSGTIDNWNPGMNSVLGVHTLASSSAHLGVGGDFTRLGGLAQQGYGQFSLDLTPPDTLLDSTPALFSNSSSASFGFHSTEQGSSFSCRLDSGPLSGCTSPVSYSGLAVGAHSFQVAATDRKGNTDPSPASFGWTIDMTAPGVPSGLTASLAAPNRVALVWAAPGDPDVAYYLVYRDGSLIGATSAAQTGYADTSVVGPTSYLYTVRAVDKAGNTSGDSNQSGVNVPAGSAPLFLDGFESGDLSRWTSSTGMLVQTQQVYAGIFAARATSTTTGTFAQEQLAQTQGELYYSLHFEPLTLGGKTTIARFLTQGGTAIASLYLTETGKLGYRNELTGASLTSTSIATAGAWHTAETRVRINGATSEIEVWLDNVRLTDLAHTEYLGTTPIGAIQLGENQTGTSYDIAYDTIATGTSFITR